MWVTQTYLGTPDPDATLFVYLIYEGYDPPNEDFTERLRIQLERVGEIFREKVSILMPGPRAIDRVSAELRERQIPFWPCFEDGLPGLLLTKKPLVNVSQDDPDNLYLPLKDGDDQITYVVGSLCRLLYDALNYDFEHQPTAKLRDSFGKRFLDAIEIKPRIGPITFDFLKLINMR